MWKDLFCACLAAATVVLTAGRAHGQETPDWTRPFPAFKLIGNVYWVGTYDLSTYLITTPQGHILVNSGLKSTVPQIADGIEKLGFKVADTKILLTTQAHWDHVAGFGDLKRLTGAKVMVSEPDAPVLADGGKSDFRWGNEPGSRFDPVTVDRRLKDGDKVTLGGVTLTAHLHPGHTKGSTSFTFTVREAGKDYRVIIANMGSINQGVTVNGMPNYPTIAADYARTFAAQKTIPVDVFLSSHAGQFRLHEKYKPGDTYDPNRFVDPKGYLAAVEDMEQRFKAQLAKERAGQ
jgi:metallo-beta-lactamase class B